MFGGLVAAGLMAVVVTASLEDLVHCDPLRKDMHCPPDPAFGGNASFDFTKASWDRDFEAFWAVDNDTLYDSRRLDFDTGGKGLAMAIRKAGDAPTLASHKYLLFGRVSVTLKAAKGRGLVTALVMKSDSGDEIDWELLGAYEKQAATNYFYDGKALFNTYNDTYALDKSSFDAYHTYGVEWTDTTLVFSIDGQARRTWRVGEIPPGSWPQTPMQVKVGVWAVDEASNGGEVQWAGGVPAWDAGPFAAHIKSVEVADFAGRCDDMGDGEGDGEYQYDERTRGWREVRIRGCKERAAAPLLAPTATPTAAAPAPTASDEGDGAMALDVPSSLALLLIAGWLLVL